MKFMPALTAPAPIHHDHWLFVFSGDKLLVRSGEPTVQIPSLADLALDHASDALYLGELDGVSCFAAEQAATAPIPDNYQLIGLRALHGKVHDAVFQLAGRAVQLIEWSRNHRFCGHCGTPTEALPGERARVCPSCSLQAYPRIAPAIMVLIRRGNELLLARSPHFPPGMFSALAGFVEPGETLEQTTAREVAEEVGVRIDNLQYFGSQPWPFPHSLMIAFIADHAGGDITIDGVEIEEAGWFHIDALPMLPGKISIARRLIDATVAGMRGMSL